MSLKPGRAQEARQVCLEIDHRPVICPEGVSVLRAAELNGIYIPALCSHKDLSAFGGCRLCVVEIEGLRGFPLACSTAATEGLKVLTGTTALREMRLEFLELILSEHPASCLICEEKEECRDSMSTVRKAGVTTGCRMCPNDGRCELQTVVEKLGLTDLRYPISYRGYEAEHDDPFFDRDYNICILCGRCVRMCQEVRGTSVLAFHERGPKTRVGPAFGRTHVEAGCEFCGACVDVCPTGTLADKASKWDGCPVGRTTSTCPFCSLGCRIDLDLTAGRLSRAHAHPDEEVNDGQLCVRGRFCLPEATHHHARSRKPILKRGPYFREVSWDEALDEVAGRLRGVGPEEFLMVVSPDLTNESLFMAQKFVRSCLGTDGIDSTAREALPGGLDLWAALFSLQISIRDLSRADAVIAVGLDSRFSFSVAGVEIRRALKAGASLVTVDSRESNLARYAGHWLRPRPGGEGLVLRELAKRLAAGSGRAGRGTASRVLAEAGLRPELFEKALAALASGRRLAVVVGPAAFWADTNGDIGRALLRLGKRGGTTVLPLYQGANTRGALELGVFSEWRPGPVKSAGSGPRLADVAAGRARPKVLYLVGEVPFFERPDCEFVISQDTYQPPFEVDAFLPAASFAEAEGTLTNVEGRIQSSIRAEDLPDGALTGFVRPDWRIFGQLAARLSCPGFEATEAAAILKEIHAVVPGFPATPDRRPRRLRSFGRIGASEPRAVLPGEGGYLLLTEPGGFRHRGTDLCTVVEGLTELGLEEGFRLHPDDLLELGLENGGELRLTMDGSDFTAVARADQDACRGVVYLTRPFAFGGLAHRRNLAPLFRRDGTPVRVAVEAARNRGGR